MKPSHQFLVCGEISSSSRPLRDACSHTMSRNRLLTLRIPSSLRHLEGQDSWRLHCGTNGDLKFFRAESLHPALARPPRVDFGKLDILPQGHFGDAVPKTLLWCESYQLLSYAPQNTPNVASRKPWRWGGGGIPQQSITFPSILI